MKNLGRALLKGAKTAVIGYCAYKLIDAAIKNKKEKEPEEYIPFDELPVEEPKKDDKVKKAVMIAGGVAVVSILSTLKTLQRHAMYVDTELCKANDRDIVLLAGVIAECGNDTPADKIRTLINLKDGAFYEESKNFIDDIIAEVK